MTDRLPGTVCAPVTVNAPVARTAPAVPFPRRIRKVTAVTDAAPTRGTSPRTTTGSVRGLTAGCVNASTASEVGADAPDVIPLTCLSDTVSLTLREARGPARRTARPGPRPR